MAEPPEPPATLRVGCLAGGAIVFCGIVAWLFADAAYEPDEGNWLAGA